jgi:hypothetical protein
MTIGLITHRLHKKRTAIGQEIAGDRKFSITELDR